MKLYNKADFQAGSRMCQHYMVRRMTWFMLWLGDRVRVKVSPHRMS